MRFDGVGMVAAVMVALSCVAAEAQTTAAVDPMTREIATPDGRLAGTVDAASGVCSFKGVPFAAPPVGALRWQEPHPVSPWTGVRQATSFGPRAMQLPIFGDMNFRSNGMSEDCLYLNVWTPTPSAGAKLPVLVYFYGGGFVAGDGSEPRYDGASMASHGIVAVTVNYRLGVFGFLAHPALTAESPGHASGNYGLLDQLAALRWVRENIGAFGGNPSRVTIAGESAGSMSVSAQMSSPLSGGLFAGAIGESGALLNLQPLPTLGEAETAGVRFAHDCGVETLEQLRAIPADELVKSNGKPGDPWARPIVDGALLPRQPREIYAAGEQSSVPLLAGVNSAENGASTILGDAEPTVDNYRAAIRRLYGANADAVLKAYPASTSAEVLDAARDLASDRFISYGTWSWIDLATRAGDQPTFYYLYDHPRPAMRPELGDARPGLAGGVIRGAATAPATKAAASAGAVHSAEIEYALGNLDGNHVFAWGDDDRAVSRTMQAYFFNFITTGNPNGGGLVKWPFFASGQRLVIGTACRVESTDALRARAAVLKAVGPTP